MKIRPVGIELFRADGQTHIYDEADYQIAFSDFADLRNVRKFAPVWTGSILQHNTLQRYLVWWRLVVMFL